MVEEEDLLDLEEEEDNIEDMYLTFGVAGEGYAVPIIYVTEIVGIQKIATVPDVPEYIRGVINLRGNVIPLMDVRLRFGLPFRKYDDRTVIIVLNVDEVRTGLIVDQVKEALEILPDQVDHPPQWQNQGEEGGVILGMGKQEEEVNIILDVHQLLDKQSIDITQFQQPLGEEKFS